MRLKGSFLQRPMLLKLLVISFSIIVLTSCERTGSQYAFQQGNFGVKVVNQLLLDFQKLEKQLPIRISYPDARGVFPVVIFSHGNGSKGDMYKGFTDFWASHGYVVIQPTHMDSRSLGFETKRDNLREMYSQLLQASRYPFFPSNLEPLFELIQVNPG